MNQDSQHRETAAPLPEALLHALAQGRDDLAEPLLQELASAATANPSVYAELARMAIDRNEPAEACQWLQQACRLESPPGQLHLHLAVLRKVLGEHEAALATISPVLRNEPAHLDALTLIREVLGQAPELSTIAWARLLADLRAPTPEVQRALDSIATLKSEIAALKAENRRLKNTASPTG